MYFKKIVQRYFSFILIQKKIHIFYLTTWFFISFPRTKLKLHGFSFLFHEEKKRNKDELLRTMSEKKFAGCIFWPTPALFYAKQKELASLVIVNVFTLCVIIALRIILSNAKDLKTSSKNIHLKEQSEFEFPEGKTRTGLRGRA